jgi:hypothetical protein
MEQALVERKRFAERRAFRAQPPEIGRMRGIAGNSRIALPVDGCEDAAADAAIRAGGAHGGRMPR